MTRYSVPMESLPTLALDHQDPSPASDPIGIILSRTDHDQALPGEPLELTVTISNKGNQSAVIDIFLDELPVVLHSWCRVTQTHLALEPGEGEDVTFRFDVPANALSGVYRYWLVVDAPNHYPDCPPLRYERTLQVLPPPQSTLRQNDPTFAVEPTTTHTKPIKTLPGNPLQFQVYVYNRADRVDRFRLSCTDLPEEWVKIDYPQGFRMPGLAITESQLDLNPDMEGVILLTLTPPPDALAKTMLVTLQLKSENNPDLTLLDLLYIQIEPVYQISTHFRTLVSRIQNQTGRYSVQAKNQGNTHRTLDFQIVGLEGSDLCHYTIQPESLTLAPYQTLSSEISVQPKKTWKRPLFGGGRVINFEVVATDPDQKPLIENPMQGLLMWEARPWWQILPVVLLLLGSFLGLIWLIWWCFIRPPAPANVLRFAPESTAYEASRGDTIHLGFDIANAGRIQQLEIVGQSPDGDLLSGPLTFDFDPGLPSALAPFCVEQQQRLTCRNVRTDARRAGEYVFTLNVIPKPGRNAQPAQAIALPVAIAPVPLPEILDIVPSDARYLQAPPSFTPSQPADDPYVVRANWRIQHPEQLSVLQLAGRDREQAVAAPPLVFNFQAGIPPELTDFCAMEAQLLTCQNVPTELRQAGTYTLDLLAIPRGEQPDEPILATSEPTHIQPRPPQLLQFTLNGEPAQSTYLVPVDDGESPLQIELAWEVEDNPGTQVMIMPAPGNVPTTGILPLPLSPEPGKTAISLQVTNTAGETLTRSLTITTYDRTPEIPTVVVNTGNEAGADADGAGGDAGAAGAGNAGAGTGEAIGPPVPIKPGTVSPQEIPPPFE